MHRSSLLLFGGLILALGCLASEEPENSNPRAELLKILSQADPLNPSSEELRAQQSYMAQDYFEGFPVDQHPFEPLIQRESGYYFRDMSGFPMMIDKYTAVEPLEDGKHRFGYYNIIYIMIPEGGCMQDCGENQMLIDMALETGVPWHAVFPTFVPNILSHFEDFYKKQLAKKPRGRAIIDIIESERSLIDSGPSIVIGITAENDLSKIYALGRVTHRGLGEKAKRLDIETRLKRDLPKIPVKERSGPIGKYWEGGWAELKTLVRAKESPETFIPMLFASAFNIRAHRGFGNFMGAKEYPFPDHFVTESFAAMQKIHRSWGFRPLLGYQSRKERSSYINRWNIEAMMGGMMFSRDPQPFSIVNSRRLEAWRPSLVLSPQEIAALQSASKQTGPKYLRLAGEMVDCQDYLSLMEQSGGLPLYQEPSRQELEQYYRK